MKRKKEAILSTVEARVETISGDERREGLEIISECSKVLIAALHCLNDSNL